MHKRGRGPVRLTVRQEDLLETVRLRNEDFWTAKHNLEAKLRKELQHELSRFKTARDVAIYEAVEAGVPKTRVAKDGLNTSSVNEIYEIINAMSNTLEFEMPVVHPYRWANVSWTENGRCIAYLQRIEGLPLEYPGDDIVPAGPGWPFARPDSASQWLMWLEGPYANPEGMEEIPDDAKEWAVANYPRFEDSEFA